MNRLTRKEIYLFRAFIRDKKSDTWAELSGDGIWGSDFRNLCSRSDLILLSSAEYDLKIKSVATKILYSDGVFTRPVEYWEGRGWSYCEGYGAYVDEELHEVNGNYYCQRYINNNFYFCDSHDVYYWQGVNCPDCQEEEDEERTGRESLLLKKKGYSWKDYPYVKTKKNIGIEIEFYKADIDALYRQGFDANRIGVLKDDGSIDGQEHERAELVFFHAPVKTIRERIETTDFHGCFGDDKSCGIHIHFSREFLSDSKWRLAQKILCKLKPWAEKIANRQENTYCHYVADANVRERYRALNFTPNQTREFRIFKSTNKKKTILSYLEFCLVIIRQARNLSEKDFLEFTSNELWLNFKNLTKGMRYHYLQEKIREKGL